MTYPTLLRTLLLVLAASSVFGCIEGVDKKKREAAAAAASANALRSLTTNTGIVEGVVIMQGDPAATEPGLAARIPKDCPDALKTYGLIFREGPGRTVADVFVAVTGYQGEAGEKSGEVTVIGRGCTWDKRTYAMTAKQRLKVKSADERPYVPALLNNKSPASLVAVPGGDGVPLIPSRGFGLYVLYDEMRNFTQATVLVEAYSTFGVTGLDGKFRIEGVPVGTSKVSALLPTANLTVEVPIEVTKNATTRVELKLRFDAADYAAKAPKAADTPAPPAPAPRTLTPAKS